MTTELPVVQCCAPLGAPRLSDTEVVELERVFKALADRHRVRILNRLPPRARRSACASSRSCLVSSSRRSATTSSSCGTPASSSATSAAPSRAAEGRHTAESAGSVADPHGRVHPEVVEVMGELDIDLSDRRPQPLTRELAERADVVVTMGCGDACPYIPDKRYVDWDLTDPKGRPVDEVRATRDEIAQRVEVLLAELEFD